MKQYFPRSLAVLEDENCTDATVVDLTQKTTNKDCEGQQESRVNSDRVSTAPALEETEEDDVKRYVKSCLKGHGLLQLIHVYLVRLGEKSCHLWYPGLSDIYVKLYHCLRKHLTIPTIWFGDNDDCSPSRLRCVLLSSLIDQREFFYFPGNCCIIEDDDLFVNLSQIEIKRETKIIIFKNTTCFRF